MEPVQTHVGPKADGARMGGIQLMNLGAKRADGAWERNASAMGDLDDREHAGECTLDDRMGEGWQGEWRRSAAIQSHSPMVGSRLCQKYCMK